MASHVLQEILYVYVSTRRSPFLIRHQKIFVLHYVYSSYIRFIVVYSFLITITSVWIECKGMSCPMLST